MTNENAILFKDLETAKFLSSAPKTANMFAERINKSGGKLAWNVDGDKCYEFPSGATLTIWHNGQCDFDADGITLPFRY